MTAPLATKSFPPADVGHFAPRRGSSLIGTAAVAVPAWGHAVIDHLTHLRPAEMTPAERAAAVAALLAAGLLRHLHPAAFTPPGRRHEFAGKVRRIDLIRSAPRA